MILSSKLTDASRFKPFAIQNIGRDERYRKINEYYGDLQKAFEKSINFLKQNPDIRITSEIREMDKRIIQSWCFKKSPR